MARPVVLGRPLTDTEWWLCCAVADDTGWHQRELAALWQRVGSAAAWTFAIAHESEGTAAIAMAEVIGESLPAEWGVARERIGTRISTMLHELDLVAARLAERGIRIVALKNAGIARSIYRDPAGSQMGDVDTLVRPSDLRSAHEALTSLGFSLHGRSRLAPESFDEAERDGGGEYRKTLADGSILWFELSSRAIGGRWVRPDQEPPADDLMQRAVPIAGSPAYVLSPEDNLLQVCLHTAKHSFSRAPGFRLHTDVDRIVRRCSIDWSRFTADVAQLRVRTPVYFSLLLAKELLQTPIPDAPLTALKPSALRTKLISDSLRAVGLFNPKNIHWGRLRFVWFSALLYDSTAGLLRAMVPGMNWMSQRYGVTRRWSLPYWYCYRFIHLLFRREKV